MCQRCKKRTATNSVAAGSPTSGTMPPPGHAPTNSAGVSQVPLVQRCEIPHCEKIPIRELTDGKILCKYHSVEHKLNTRPGQPIRKPASAPRPFKKSDLYHMKPEDKIYLNKKRKRGSSSNRGSSVSSVGQGRRVASMQGKSFPVSRT
jgi:hypothetical protein